MIGKDVKDQLHSQVRSSVGTGLCANVDRSLWHELATVRAGVCRAVDYALPEAFLNRALS